MKAFIISLSKIQTSAESAAGLLTELQKLNFDVTLFEGTYGNDAVEMFQKENRKSHIETDNFKFTSPGVQGCFHSHYRLWQKCVELDEAIAIFEDDVIVYRPYREIDFTDVLVLSINYDWKAVEQYKVYLETECPEKEAQLYQSRCMPGCSGYILKPHVAAQLIETYKHTYAPADWAINSEICKIEIHPQLIGRSKMMHEKQSLTRSKNWI